MECRRNDCCENVRADESAKEQVKIYLSKWKEQMEEDAEELSEAVEEKAAFFQS